MHLAELTIEKAKTLEGTIFEITLDDGRSTTMKLEEALPYELRQPRRARMREPKRTAFSLFFSGDPAIVLPQGMYAFRSEAATFESLFIVPIGRDDQATEYEAVFT
jgi:hypothetical protein